MLTALHSQQEWEELSSVANRQKSTARRRMTPSDPGKINLESILEEPEMQVN